jgi:uncharacterized protein DUF4304
MRTVQESFDQMVSSNIRPRLKALGFRGSGSTFVWPDDNYFAQIGMQKSAYSDSHVLKFTMNVTVAELTAWEKERESRTYLPKKPAPNRKYGSFIWQERIGRLLPGGQDKWWEMSSEQDWTSLADEVVTAITDFALPAMKRQFVT